MVVNTWLENPYWQYFTGETYLQTELPIDPSSLTRWRKRLGETGVELLLSLTINATKQLTVVQEKSLDRVIVDTIVMPKAIAHPTDSALLETARQHLVAFAKENSLALRQNYNKEAPRLAIQVGRYAHARQYNRMHGSLRKFKSRVGRIHRELILLQICWFSRPVPSATRPRFLARIIDLRITEHYLLHLGYLHKEACI